MAYEASCVQDVELNHDHLCVYCKFLPRAEDARIIHQCHCFICAKCATYIASCPSHRDALIKTSTLEDILVENQCIVDNGMPSNMLRRLVISCEEIPRIFLNDCLTLCVDKPIENRFIRRAITNNGRTTFWVDGELDENVAPNFWQWKGKKMSKLQGRRRRSVQPQPPQQPQPPHAGQPHPLHQAMHKTLLQFYVRNLDDALDEFAAAKKYFPTGPKIS